MRSVIFLLVQLSLAFLMAFVGVVPSSFAIELDEARFTNSFQQLTVRVKIVDVERNQKSIVKGSLYSENSLTERFAYNVEGAGKDVELVLRLDEQLRESLEFALEIDFEGDVVTRRYQLNPSLSEPMDGNVEITAEHLAESRPITTFELSLADTVYVVRQEQTLWDVAEDLPQLGGNNFQRSLAIFATNRHKFDNSDVNEISVRTVLAIPSPDYVRSFDPERSATVFFGTARGQLMIDAFLESAERLATSSDIDIPTEQMILARRVRYLEQKLEEMNEKYENKIRRITQDINRRIRSLEE